MHLPAWVVWFPAALHHAGVTDSALPWASLGGGELPAALLSVLGGHCRVTLEGGLYGAPQRHEFKQGVAAPILNEWLRRYAAAFDCEDQPVTVRVQVAKLNKVGTTYFRYAGNWPVFPPSAPSGPALTAKSLGWDRAFMGVLQRAALHAFEEFLPMSDRGFPSAAPQTANPMVNMIAEALDGRLAHRVEKPLEHVYVRLGEMADVLNGVGRRQLAPRFFKPWSTVIAPGETVSVWKGCPWTSNISDLSTPSIVALVQAGQIPMTCLLRVSVAAVAGDPPAADGDLLYSTSVAPSAQGLFPVPANPAFLRLGEPGAEFGVGAPLYIANRPAGAGVLSMVMVCHAMYIPLPGSQPLM